MDRPLRDVRGQRRREDGREPPPVGVDPTGEGPAGDTDGEAVVARPAQNRVQGPQFDPGIDKKPQGAVLSGLPARRLAPAELDEAAWASALM